MRDRKELQAIYYGTINRILANVRNFTAFTHVAAQHYKHSIIDQVMIYGQEPAAKLVANRAVWERLGATIRLDAVPIETLVHQNATLIPEELFSESQVNIDEGTKQRFLQQWSGGGGRSEMAVQLAKVEKEYEDAPQEYLNRMTRNAYYYQNLSDEDTMVSDAAFCQMAESIVAYKLGVNDESSSIEKYFTELRENPSGFPKAFQNINRTVKFTCANLIDIAEKGMIDYERAEQEKPKQRNRKPRTIRHESSDISGNELPGGLVRPADGGQLTFDAILSADGNAADGQRVERGQERATKGRDSETAARGLSESDGTLQPDRHGSTGRSEPGDGKQVATNRQRRSEQEDNRPNSNSARGLARTFGGEKTRYKQNVDAIRLMKRLNDEGQQPTDAEKKQLRAYVGWGGIPNVFDPKKKDWEKEYAELKELLTEQEYEQARRTVLNAHYTPEEIIRLLYKAVGKTGFAGGRVLEPALGIGKFFEALPREWPVDLHAAELDSISGRIAQLLHPNAKIHIMGYQDVLYPDGFFDASFSNVPFGNYGVADPKYNTYKWSIHDYFFGKTLDKVRPGGLIVFITSKYLMDSKSSKVRRYISQRAELMGAVRLPAGTFKGIANTEVTTDVLFLKKRDKELIIDEHWLHLGLTDNGVPVNEYYLDNPDCLLGTMEFSKNMYGSEKDTACINSDPNVDILQELEAALSSLSERWVGEYIPPQQQNENSITEEKDAPPPELPADPDVKNFTYSLVDDTLYYRENDTMVRQDEIKGKQLQRIMSLIVVREALMNVIEIQQQEGDAIGLRAAQGRLQAAYDEFVKKHGYINARENKNAFREDADVFLLQAIETKVKDGEYEKADIFYKRTIHAIKAPVIETIFDALAASLNYRGVVDISYMSTIYGKTEQEIISELGDRVYLNPQTGGYETADAYLSGNVREKLRIVQDKLETMPELKRNELALVAAQPRRLSLGDIEFQLGSAWIPLKTKEDFMYEVLRVPKYLRAYDDVLILHDEHANRYKIKGKAAARNNCKVAATEVLGTARRSAFTLIEDSLNLQVATVFDTVEKDGKKRQVLNGRETELARTKQAALQAEFSAWVANDKNRVAELEDIYNEKFNKYVPRKFDGSFIQLDGMSEFVELRPHQKDAAARIFLDGNTLLAHEVGAGKTYTVIAGLMLKKQAGLCQKPMIAIPNHMLDDWTKAFYTLFPNANILVTTKKDFEANTRKRFISRIATGDYDAVIITHSQFERIPMSPEYQSKVIQEEIADIQLALDTSGEHTYSVKRLEKQKASLEAKFAKMAAEGRKDDTLYFDQLGIDSLAIDEAHNYKNCFVYTKLNNVAGMLTSRADKSFDLSMKMRYIDESTGYKGNIFATGTPVSNSLAELFVMQRYIQRDILEDMGLLQFDDWASAFAVIDSELEIPPEGTGFRDRTRFLRFHNLPELMSVFHQSADIKLIEELDIKRPTLQNGKPTTVIVEPSEFVVKYIGELAVQADQIRKGMVDRHENNMLLVTMNGRRAAIDPRLIDPSLPADKSSKIYVACDNVHEIYLQYNEQKALQTMFLDFGIPLYPEIKSYLMELGIPEREIAIIHDADTDEKKADLFQKCRDGDVRVLIGSTAKMGAGMNVQHRMIALHDLDAPWRPSDLEQRHGRIQRQLNMFDEVQIFQYVTRNTFDAYLYQTLEQKQKGISQIMTLKSHARSTTDIDETVLNYAEVKACAVGDTRVKEVMELDNNIRRLTLEKQSFYSSQQRLQDIVDKAPGRIERLKQKVVNIKQDRGRYSPPQEFEMVIGGLHYDKRADAAQALQNAMRNTGIGDNVVGEYAGFDLVVRRREQHTNLFLSGAGQYAIETGSSSLGNITRIENTPTRFEQEQDNAAGDIVRLQHEYEEAKENVGQSFPHAEELSEYTQKKASLDFEIEMELKQDQLVVPGMEMEME